MKTENTNTTNNITNTNNHNNTQFTQQQLNCARDCLYSIRDCLVNYKQHPLKVVTNVINFVLSNYNYNINTKNPTNTKFTKKQLNTVRERLDTIQDFIINYQQQPVDNIINLLLSNPDYRI